MRNVLPFRSPSTVAAAIGTSAALLAALATPALPAAAIAAATPVAPVRVIAQATSVEVARAAVAAVGGEVSMSLPIVNGVAASLAPAAAATLRSTPGIIAVTPDASMQVQSAIRPQSRPPSVYGPVVGTDKLAAGGYTGAGVTVALVDTGINDSPDLAGRVLTVEGRGWQEGPCVNLSGDPDCTDGYGHGTFLAGIIAGDGTQSGGRYAGAAPQANLISVKVAAADGSADVSNVLAGIQWVVSYRETYNIRVLNLSFGTDSTQSWLVSPLNYAVERAWAAGVVVVVSASNRGPDSNTISKPGDDPYVITVGASDDWGTLPLDDDVIPDFSGRGPTPDGFHKPDIVAPGAHIVSLRAVGSEIDGITQHADPVYMQGSGTSMSAAVVSGAVADILSAHPDWSPDRVKYALSATARSDGVDDPDVVGAGLIDAYGALDAAEGLANQGLGSSNGLGGLIGGRGNVVVETDDYQHVVLDGLLTAQLLRFRLIDLTGIWSRVTWQLSPYSLFDWYPTIWHGDQWYGHNWEGCEGGGARQQDLCSYGHNWEGSTWYGAWD